ncbi:MAG: 50S ribosomal protein L3 [Bdellovibrionales bacterium]
MSETQETKKDGKSIQLGGLFAFKVGMSTVFNDKGEAVPVTVLKYEPWIVSALKTKEKHGYAAVQVACRPARASRGTKAGAAQLKGAGFENGAKFVRELRQTLPEGVEVGQRVEIDSLKKGDTVKVTGTSRGRGFSGVVRRWSFAGGPATHGSGFHRKPGSVGNRTWPGRVIAGKRMAGHYGAETSTVLNLEIVDVLPDESVLLIKGAVPGHRNSLVQLTKV